MNLVNKRTLIFASLILFVVIGVSFRSARSLFNTKASILGLSISVADFVNNPIDLEIIEGKPINALNYLPGQWTDYATIKLRNQTILPINFYMYTKKMDGSICPSTNIQVQVSEDGESAWQTVYEGITEDLRGNNDRLALTVDEDFSKDQLYVRQRIQLDDEADKNDEGEECLWDEVFRAENKDEDYDKELFIARNKLTSYYWTAPELTVENPKNSKDTFEAGKEEKIKWKVKTPTHDEDLIKIKVDLYDATGTTLIMPIADDIYATNTYKWLVPAELVGGQYKIKVHALDNHGLENEDFSDEAFTVVVKK